MKDSRNVIGTYADKFSSISDEQVNSIIKIALAAASIGPAIMIFGKMVIGVSEAWQEHSLQLKKPEELRNLRLLLLPVRLES